MGIVGKVELNPILSGSEEIAANQRGRLTALQQSYFDPRKRRSLRVAEWILLVILLGVAVFSIELWVSFTPAPWYVLAIIELVLLGLNIILALLLVEEYQLVSDMKNNRIAQSEGAVIWKRSRYVMQVSKGRLKLLKGELNLLPGDYRFCYLDRSRMMLSAERLNRFDQQQTKEQLMKILSAAVPFSDEAFACNQHRHLHRSQFVHLGMDLIGRAILLLLVAALTIYAIQRTPSVGLLILGALWAGYIVWRLAPPSLDLLKDMRAQTVCQIYGVANKTHLYTGERRYDYVWVGDAAFRPTEQGYRAIVADIPYRAYYTPRSRTLLSIEPWPENHGIISSAPNV